MLPSRHQGHKPLSSQQHFLSRRHLPTPSPPTMGVCSGNICTVLTENLGGRRGQLKFSLSSGLLNHPILTCLSHLAHLVFFLLRRPRRAQPSLHVLLVVVHYQIPNLLNSSSSVLGWYRKSMHYFQKTGAEPLQSKLVITLKCITQHSFHSALLFLYVVAKVIYTILAS